MKNGKIVIVDDDETLISTLKTLLYLEDFSNAEFFTDPRLALEYIKDNAPDLIMSDFVMPEMNGLEFLSKANELYPEVSKILLTGYADKEMLIKKTLFVLSMRLVYISILLSRGKMMI